MENTSTSFTGQLVNWSTGQLLYTLQIADTILIHAQRLGEWCGHGPILEQDIALTNTSLDHIGAARSLYQHAADQFNALSDADKAEVFTSPALTTALKEKGSVSEDDMAYLRDSWDFHNVLLVEQPNEDWAYTVAKSFFLDAFNYFFYQKLQSSSDPLLAAVAEKSLKEVSYHLKWSSEWVIRLGDGTEESAARMQSAVNDRWTFTGELFQPSPAEKLAAQQGNGVDSQTLKADWMQRVEQVFAEANIQIPQGSWMQHGGKEGIHSEHLGYILAEMQYMQRAYPGMEW